MRFEINQALATHPDYIAFLREHPDWYSELCYRPENFKLFVDYYKEERKLTFPDKIEKGKFIIEYVGDVEVMNEMIDAFVESLKKEQVYIGYLNAKQELESHADLLYLYQSKKEEYLKMRPYFKYQDFSELKKEVQDLSNQVSHLESFQKYMKAQNDLKERLDKLTQMIFKDVFLEAEVGACVSSQENLNAEI